MSTVRIRAIQLAVDWYVIEDGRIAAIYAVLAPDKLGHLTASSR